MRTKKMPCGPYEGSGRSRHYDGVGGKWDETCWQCRGKGIVEVLIQ
jgi:hypothetical protein